MRAFSTREVADLIGESQARVRSAARAGFVAPLKTPQGHYRFSFQDLVLLRSTKALEQQNLGVRRTWRALRAVREALPANRPLSSVRVLAVNNRLLVRENNTSWEPESKQTLFDFVAEAVPPATGSASNTPILGNVVVVNTADYWFTRGLRMDRADTLAEAETAYRKALELEPEHVNAQINLGRLLHTAGGYAQAEALYRRALDLQPDHAVAAFNLGVVLEDQGILDAALNSYERAVRADPKLPDAHYNLARLLEYRGDQALASRHLARFRALSRDDH